MLIIKKMKILKAVILIVAVVGTLNKGMNSGKVEKSTKSEAKSNLHKTGQISENRLIEARALTSTDPFVLQHQAVSSVLTQGLQKPNDYP